MTRAWDDWCFDGTLAAALPFVAWRIVAARTLRAAVVLFIALGLLSALAWVRLEAVDVALVEAALGTGLTGALLMSSLAWAEKSRSPPPTRSLARAALGVALVGGGLSLGWMVLGSAHPSHGLTAEVFAEMQRSGASHPVTAVLLNFRGYDTLLEVVVLLVAAIAVRSVQPVPSRRAAIPAPDLLAAFVNLLVPPGILIAGYLVWEGSHAPGGGFQAGAVLAGCAVVLLLANRIRPPGMSLAIRTALLLGPVLFLVLAGAPLLVDGRLLEYPHAQAGALLLALEASLTLSIAVILTMFFPAPRTDRAESPRAAGDAP